MTGMAVIRLVMAHPKWAIAAFITAGLITLSNN
jgi:hypothetical protein